MMLAARPGHTLRPTLRVIDVVAIIVGTVVGAGIFRTPSLVAANATSEAAALGAWVAGGAISLIGALCYAELAAAYPSPGGDYHYLARAFGIRLAFLYAWARITVIQTGSIALLAFVIGDYATKLAPLEVASAWKPSAARMRAEPASQGFGITNAPGASWRARKRAAFSLWLTVMMGLLGPPIF